MAKLDIAKLAARLGELNKPRGGSGGGMGFLSLKDGRNVLRVLPPKGDADFYQEVFVHYGVGKSEDNTNGHTVTCPTTHGEDKACPVCEVVKELYKLSKKKDDSYEKQARQLGRKKRVYFNAISRDEKLNAYYKKDDKWFTKVDGEEKEQTPVKVLGTGVSIFKAILGLIVDPEYGDVTDETEGLDLIITRTGSGFSTEYDVKTVRKESPSIPEDAPEGLQEEWKGMLHDLTNLAKVKTYEEIEALMNGEDVPEPKDEDVDDQMSNLKPKDDVEASNDTPADEPKDDLQAEIEAALRRKRS
jgi:hypothetical protein